MRYWYFPANKEHTFYWAYLGEDPQLARNKLDMLELPAQIKSAFEKGEFSIRQTSGSFNGIWSDMGTEKTIIKDPKGSGGIVII
jgi:hypothetical protein